MAYARAFRTTLREESNDLVLVGRGLCRGKEAGCAVVLVIQQTPTDMSARTMVVSHLSWPISFRYHARVSQSQGTHGPYSKERRYRRFDLHFPVSLSYPWAGMVREVESITRNVSVGGLLVTANDHVPLRTPVRLTMNVVGVRFRRPVRLSGEGEVVRVESLGPGAGFAIAVECKRPIEEIEDHLPA